MDIALLILVYFSLYQVDITRSQEIGQASVEQALSNAYEAIHDAEEAGADVSTLVNLFNQAQNYLEQARSGIFESCSSTDDCLSKSFTICNSIITKANSLGEQASSDRSFNRTSLVEVYSPAIAISASTIMYLIFNKARKNPVKGSLDMQTSRREET